MSRVVEKTLYQFDELSDRAKERARDWWRECENQDFDTDFLFEDFVQCGEILGIEFDQQPVKLMGGGTRYDPIIYWSGFSSQGDGACFVGRYAYAKGSVAKIIDHAPGGSDGNNKLHEIARELAEIQRKYFYQVSARVKHRGRGSADYNTEIEVFDDRTGDYIDNDDSEAVIECLRGFMRWMYRQLETEYNYRMADEQVDDAITANEYEFDECGRRAS